MATAEKTGTLLHSDPAELSEDSKGPHEAAGNQSFVKAAQRS